MKLREFVTEKRTSIMEALRNHQKPEGRVLSDRFDDAMQLPVIQFGATRYTPHSVILEFNFRSNSDDTTIIVPIAVTTPELVVFMPVPQWVHVNIWQGEVRGSFRFSSEAHELIASFSEEAFSNGTSAFETQGAYPYQRES